MTAPPRLSAAGALRRLKGFQRDAVEYAFHRLYDAADSTRRFLVADEVGLGKTLIARGIIAKAIERLSDGERRVDIIYICSNAGIARQNLRKLTLSSDSSVTSADRITMLPTHLKSLSASKLNFIALTPGTSFDLKRSQGTRRERALLLMLLERIWPVAGTGPLNLFQGWAKNKQYWRDLVEEGREEWAVSDELCGAFARELSARSGRAQAEGRQALRVRYDGLCETFQRFRETVPLEDVQEQTAFLGELRAALARTCINALEPDLVILDEFQRFKHLLSGKDDASLLARDLFTYSDATSDARVLLLSATPYKMYTLAHEQDEDDHYTDFLSTVEFLNHDSRRSAEFSDYLADYRRELYRLGDGGGERLPELKRSIEASLRRVMSRTERAGVGLTRDGMLREVAPSRIELREADVGSYLASRRVADVLEQPGIMDYWKSAPFFLNFMEKYAVKKALVDCERSPHKEVHRRVAQAIDSDPCAVLQWKQVEGYADTEPANPRMRAFVAELMDRQAWQLLWLPPSLPSYQLTAPFGDAAAAGLTKRLVFSSWAVVPKAISSLLSYEVERRVFSAGDEAPQNTAEARAKRKGLLRFSRSDGRLTGMPVLALLYPSPSLAELGDPITAASEWRRARQATEPADQAQPTRDDVLAVVERRIASALAPVLTAQVGQDAPIEMGAKAPGQPDESWYWATPILLDAHRHGQSTEQWFAQYDLAKVWSSAGGDAQDDDAGADDGWSDHVHRLRENLTARDQLGSPPSDLAHVLAQVGVGGPAVAALRALGRIAGGTARVDRLVLRNAAARIGWSFRSLYNRPESMAIVRAVAPGEIYWRQVLDYGCLGGLSAVLDEYAHVLRDLEGLFDKPLDNVADVVAERFQQSLGLRASNQEVHEIRVARSVDGDSGSGTATFSLTDRRMRAHFAARFGRVERDDGAEAQREDQVRAAFNSPFWPFVLATTSVGQEGLDFHPYCHAVVHWNLPTNPVDMEQREGRVHRFEGHAVRKNVARRHGDEVLREWSEAAANPWHLMFERARLATNGNDYGGLVPYWVYPLPDGASIERHVPALPLSRDTIRLAALKRSLAVYRMVFGQPRQDDLLAFLLERVGQAELERHLDSLQIDLAPPRFKGATDPGTSSVPDELQLVPDDDGEGDWRLGFSPGKVRQWEKWLDDVVPRLKADLGIALPNMSENNLRSMIAWCWREGGKGFSERKLFRSLRLRYPRPDVLP